ncbi:MAG: FAD-dependent oxidoreductase [Pseudolabrys sp.]
MDRAGSVHTDIVLLGGGHAHVHVLTAFAMRPLPGARLTLITRDVMTPYSGMLPGLVAGLYRFEQAHIDLVRLATATGTRFIHAESIGLDRANKRVLLAGQPSIVYDILSIDVGIAPALAPIPGAAEHAVAVKPIGSFLNKFGELLERCGRPDGPRRIAVIGGGAGGVELLLSVRTRLLAEAREAGVDADAFAFTLVTNGEILATHNARVRDAFRQVFAARGIALHEHRAARAVTDRAIEMDNGEAIAADAVLITAGGSAPSWFRGTGLDLDPKGFLAVAPTLQATNDPDVFAAGDCAALATPREKAGVYAVRAGPPLADNLRHRARGEPLKPWHPQRRHLALISTGERYAIASRGALKAEGAWLWTVKDWIDCRWIRTYQDVDTLVSRVPPRVSA